MQRTFADSFGLVVYDPDRQKMRANTQWWCVLQISPGISASLRWFLDRHWWDAPTHPRGVTKDVLMNAPWEGHISIIRGEMPRQNRQDWGKFNANARVPFYYDLNPRRTRKGDFWFVDADFAQYVEIRKHFGLPWRHPNGTPFLPHITISKIG